MAEREIFNFLKSNPNKFYAVKDLSGKIDLNETSLKRCLPQMAKFKMIEMDVNRKPRRFGFLLK
jgi:hypothetical protein